MEHRKEKRQLAVLSGDVGRREGREDEGQQGLAAQELPGHLGS